MGKILLVSEHSPQFEGSLTDTDQVMKILGTKRRTITEHVQSLKEIGFSLPVFSNKQYLPTSDRYCRVSEIPELRGLYGSELHHTPGCIGMMRWK